MKLEMTGSNTVTSAKGGASFGAKIGAKSFWLLSSGIYSRKALAVIREVSCNAMDAHIMSGQPDRPIEVWLPTAEKPVFQVRDYGTGMTEDEIFNLYTTYFESGKDSGDYSSGLFKTDGPIDLDKADAATGGFGLGSKSPFALTDQFTVTSVRDGRKRIYSCAVNHERVPETVKLWEGDADADWTSGIMVTVPVPVSTVDEFIKEAAAAFRPFDVKPVFLEREFAVPEEPELKAQLGPLALRVSPEGETRRVVARMARVDYPLDVSALNLRGPLKEFVKLLVEHSEYSLTLHLPTGSIIPAPSREALQYYKGAVNAITEQLTRAMDHYRDTILSHFADPDAPRQMEIAAARQWLTTWLTPHILRKGRETAEAVLGSLVLPASARGLLATGLMTAPRQDFPGCEVFAYVAADSDVGQGVRRCRVIRGKVARGGRDGWGALELQAGVEVMYAEGEHIDARVRAYMAGKIRAARASTGSMTPAAPVMLIQSVPKLKTPVDTLKAVAEGYAEALLTSASSVKVLPSVKQAPTAGTPRPRLTPEERLLNAEVTVLLWNAKSLEYELRASAYRDIKDIPNLLTWRSAKGRGSWGDPRPRDAARLNACIKTLKGAGVPEAMLRHLIPGGIIRVHGVPSPGEEAVMRQVPTVASARDSFLRALEALVGGPGVRVKVLPAYYKDRLFTLRSAAGMSQAQLLERLGVHVNPSPYVATITSCLAAPASLVQIIEGVRELANSLDGSLSCWLGAPSLVTEEPRARVVGLAPHQATSIEHFLRMTEMHEELYQALNEGQ